MFGVNKNLNVHFIGIGGIGMSGIAEVLLSLGYNVTGSDLNDSEVVNKLRSLGAQIYIGHEASNVKNVQIVVYSSAVNNSNPEVQEAKKTGIPIIKRAEMLAELMRLKKGIAVAGSHGKTTTTSFLATILEKLDYKPTYIIGGIVKNLGGHAHIGDSDLLVAEADESDGSFLYLNPIMSVVTNIDNDHLDYYGNIENLKKAFVEFLNKVPFYGLIVLNAHDETTAEILNQIKRPYKVFSIEGDKNYIENADYMASNLEHTDAGMSFDLKFEDQTCSFEIQLSGNHNVLNAIGSIVVAHQLGAKFEDIQKVISDFEGVSRRLEKLKNDDELLIIDDYAHHPTELVATISTLRKKYKNKKLIAIFEPHRYSRTQSFWKEFVESFEDVDSVYVSPIYPASEEPIQYIDSEILVKNINEKYSNAFFIKSLDDMKSILDENKNNNALIVTLGAGPISKTIRKILNG